MEPLPLKDIHLPEASHWWPPAVGWWLLAILLPLTIVLAIYLYKRLRRQTALKTARKLLAVLRRENPPPAQTVAALSTLLRRVAISTAPRAEAASLHGEAWLAYLDTSFPDAPFSQGAGRCLADAQYRKNVPTEMDMDALIDLCERWLKKQGSTKARMPMLQSRRVGLRPKPFMPFRVNPADEGEK